MFASGASSPSAAAHAEETLVISDVTATPAATSAVIAWTTNLPADARVEYGTAPGSLLWSESDGSLVTEHSLMIMNLLQGVAYFYRVTSVAAGGESATFPAPPDPPLSFTTIGYDVVAATPDPGAIITSDTPCLTIPVIFTREDATPVRAYSVTLSISENLRLCGAGFVSAGYPVPPQTFMVTVLDEHRWTIDETTLGWPCGADGSGILFTMDVGADVLYGSGTITIESVRVRDCVNGAVPALAGGPVEIPIDITADVADPDAGTTIDLLPAAPNPFGETTRLRYHLAVPGAVELAVFSIDGRLVRVLRDGLAPAGEASVLWDGADRQGRRAPSGPYTVRLRASGEERTQSLILLR
jgi:hypothetical protein